MSEAAIRAALESRLNGLSPTLSTAWENVAFTPVAGTPYQRVTLLPADPENPSIGASLQRLSGILHVHLFYPIGVGSATALARAEAIKARFPRGLTLTSGGVTVHIPSTPAIGAARVDGDRYALPVRVAYRANVFS